MVDTSSSSSPACKAPVVTRLMSVGFLRPPSPLRRPPEPLEDMELEELGSRGLLTVGNCGRLYGGISSEPGDRGELSLGFSAHTQQIIHTLFTECSSTWMLSCLARSATLMSIPFFTVSTLLSLLGFFPFRWPGPWVRTIPGPVTSTSSSLVSAFPRFGGDHPPALQRCLGWMCRWLENSWRRNRWRREIWKVHRKKMTCQMRATTTAKGTVTRIFVICLSSVSHLQGVTKTHLHCVNTHWYQYIWKDWMYIEKKRSIQHNRHMCKQEPTVCTVTWHSSLCNPHMLPNRRRSNTGPSACKAGLITATLWNH